jgi:hypothetical protein
MEIDMSNKRRGTAEAEPVGIVISRGSRDEPPPRFWAYIWGPVPENVIEDATKAA